VNGQYKKVGDLALKDGEIELAINCFKAGKDLGSQLLIYSSLGLKDELGELAKTAEDMTMMNVAFTVYFILADLENCLSVLIKCKRFPEAAMFSKAYCPSQISRCVSLWKQYLKDNGHFLTAQKIADPMEYLEDENFADLNILLQVRFAMS